MLGRQAPDLSILGQLQARHQRTCRPELQARAVTRLAGPIACAQAAHHGAGEGVDGEPVRQIADARARGEPAPRPIGKAGCRSPHPPTRCPSAARNARSGRRTWPRSRPSSRSSSPGLTAGALSTSRSAAPSIGDVDTLSACRSWTRTSGAWADRSGSDSSPAPAAHSPAAPPRSTAAARWWTVPAAPPAAAMCQDRQLRVGRQEEPVECVGRQGQQIGQAARPAGKPSRRRYRPAPGRLKADRSSSTACALRDRLLTQSSVSSVPSGSVCSRK